MAEQNPLFEHHALEWALECYGQVFHNLEYHTNRQAYRVWFADTLEELRAQELTFRDQVECYMKICEELRTK